LPDEPGAETVRVNDLVELFGVIELGGEIEDFGENPHPMQQLLVQDRSRLPPPSAQPRLHCLWFRRLEPQLHPLLPAPSTREESLALDAARAQLLGCAPS